jgi:hypothetical protein
MATHHLFISHSWSYSDAYEKLIKLLDAASHFTYSDYSVPKDDPIHDAPYTAALRSAIANQMSHAGVVLMLAGVYATYSKWINIEIDIARNSAPLPKPILAIEPWGSEKTSEIVKKAADKIVGWNTSSMVSAVRELD